jgi:hypothetical protein
MTDGPFERSIPYTLAWDHAPLDISGVFADERPAGRHGFLQVQNGRFVFADGAEARFWGTNFNSGQCFPSHEHSEKVAARLAHFGVNIVRFHQMDAEWSTPNLFQYAKGQRLENTRSLDSRSMDCLDYLIAQLKMHGIYVYLDMLTYRRFRSGDGVAAAEQLGDAAKPYCCFDPRLIALQKEFNEQLWTHQNPYTGLAYRDEPAIVLTEVVNEADLFHNHCTVEPYRTALEQRYVAWAREKDDTSVRTPVDFTKPTGRLVEFMAEVHREYYRTIIEHLRGIGVRIPVAGTNWSGHAGLLASQIETDFSDNHAYWYDWCWKTTDKRFNNRTMLGERDGFFGHLTSLRLEGKPFFVSEWDDPWPNEWRAESVLLLAAVACLQGWQGVAIHTYRYTTREDADCIGQAITSDAIGGVYYRGGVFDTFNDPAKFGLFYHAALMLRRQDVARAAKRVVVDMSPMFRDGVPLYAGDCAAMQGAVETHEMAVRVPGLHLSEAEAVEPDTATIPAQAQALRSDTGEMRRDLTRRMGLIDADMTKVVYGFLGAVGLVELDGLSVLVKTGFGVVALSSLTREPVGASDNILLTAVGRADNTGCRYNADHTVQFALGHGPIQAEIIEADIELRTSVEHARVWAINPDGFPIGQIPSVRRDGILRFTIGREYASMYYLIQKV